jgi:hypothetical protein
MDETLRSIFMREVERQCKFALLAGQDLAQALQGGEMDRIWYSVQSILVAAGNISKLLWPPGIGHKVRGEDLRKALNVTNGSPLEPRTFRNHFEHFDERLEDWATASQRRNFVDSNVMPPGAIAGIDPADYLRNLDPVGWTLTFRGDSYALRPVIQAVQDLWEIAAFEAAKWP